MKILKAILLLFLLATQFCFANSSVLFEDSTLNKGATGSVLNEQKAVIAKVENPSEHPNSVVQDADGNVFAVDENGTATQVGTVITDNISIEKGSRSENLGEVTFSLIEEQNMILDRDAGAFANKALINDHYETLKSPLEGGGGAPYKVPWTFVPTGKMREIRARISKSLSGYQPSDIQFICAGNIRLESEYHNDGTFTVKLFGGDDRSTQSVYAVVNQAGTDNYFTLGKIKLAHYSEKTLDVVIVPVNRSVETQRIVSLQEELNAIYNPVGITVNLLIDSTFTVNAEEYDFLNNGLQVDESGTWTNETEEMKLLKFLYKQQRAIDPQTAYLFLLDRAEIANVAGDMPRGKQAGYIFGDNLNARLVAHELGHGAFALEHTSCSKY